MPWLTVVAVQRQPWLDAGQVARWRRKRTALADDAERGGCGCGGACLGAWVRCGLAAGWRCRRALAPRSPRTPRPHARPAPDAVACCRWRMIATPAVAATEVDPTTIPVGTRLVQLGAFDDDADGAGGMGQACRRSFPDAVGRQVDGRPGGPKRWAHLLPAARAWALRMKMTRAGSARRCWPRTPPASRSRKDDRSRCGDLWL